MNKTKVVIVNGSKRHSKSLASALALASMNVVVCDKTEVIDYDDWDRNCQPEAVDIYDKRGQNKGERKRNKKDRWR